MNSRPFALAVLLAALPASSLVAQAAAAAPAASTAVPPAAEQIAAAVLALPTEMRDAATVMGYKEKGKLEVLRPGTNGMHCLALYVVREDFHVACYHKSLEAFMARGRELRAKGITKLEAVDSVRFAEIKSGKLKMPAAGALYSLTGKKAGFNPATNTVTGASPLHVVYMPFATAESTGISEKMAVASKAPFLMFPGTAKAHLMIIGTMGSP